MRPYAGRACRWPHSGAELALVRLLGTGRGAWSESGGDLTRGPLNLKLRSLTTWRLLELLGFDECGFNQNSMNQSLIGIVIAAARRLGREGQYKKQEAQAENMAMMRGGQDWSHRLRGRGQEALA